jgi:hypothetical protein
LFARKQVDFPNTLTDRFASNSGYFVRPTFEGVGIGYAPRRERDRSAPPDPAERGRALGAPDGTDDRPYRRADDRAREDDRAGREGEDDRAREDDRPYRREDDPEGEDPEGDEREDRREDDRREGEGRPEDRPEDDGSAPYGSDPGADRASAYGREASEVGDEVERNFRRDGEVGADAREASEGRSRGSLREGLPRREADPEGRVLAVEPKTSRKAPRVSDDDAERFSVYVRSEIARATDPRDAFAAIDREIGAGGTVFAPGGRAVYGFQYSGLDFSVSVSPSER